MGCTYVLTIRFHNRPIFQHLFNRFYQPLVSFYLVLHMHSLTPVLNPSTYSILCSTILHTPGLSSTLSFYSHNNSFTSLCCSIVRWLKFTSSIFTLVNPVNPPLVTIDCSCTSGTSTLETYYSNFIARQLYAQKCQKCRKIQNWPLPPPGSKFKALSQQTFVLVVVFHFLAATVVFINTAHVFLSTTDFLWSFFS